MGNSDDKVCPYEVKLSKLKIPTFLGKFDSEADNSLAEWLVTRLDQGPPYAFVPFEWYDLDVIAFQNKRDALYCKLRWG